MRYVFGASHGLRVFLKSRMRSNMYVRDALCGEHLRVLLKATDAFKHVRALCARILASQVREFGEATSSGSGVLANGAASQEVPGPDPQLEKVQDLLVRATRCVTQHGVHPLLGGATIFQAMYSKETVARTATAARLPSCLNLPTTITVPGVLPVPVGAVGSARQAQTARGAPAEDLSTPAQPAGTARDGPSAGTAVPQSCCLWTGPTVV